MTLRPASEPRPPTAIRLAQVQAQLARIVVGKDAPLRLALACLLARGHLLIEDIPGVGKSTLAQALAATLGLKYSRIQFTSDLLPADVLGVSIYDERNQAFRFHPGPIFSAVVLADEINRAPPKTQSALLEAMEERQVSLDGQTRRLPDPFFVIATQNPIEQIGAYPLPESQLDRFLMRLRLGYPAPEHEAAVLRDDPAATAVPKLEPVVSGAEVRALRRAASKVKLDDGVVGYLLSIVGETRTHEALALGASPRGAVALRRAAQARALSDGRDFCIPEDVRELAVPVLAHRLVAQAHGPRQGSEEVEWLVREIVGRVPVPL